MPHFPVQIGPTGPLFDAFIRVSKSRFDALTAAKQPIPPAQPIRALLDTGASASCLDLSVVAALGLQPTGNTSIVTPSTGNTPHIVNVYDISILVPAAVLRTEGVTPPLIFNTVAVAGCDLLQTQGFHALIGRDILSVCMFYYNGPGNVIIVSY